MADISILFDGSNGGTGTRDTDDGTADDVLVTITNGFYGAYGINGDSGSNADTISFEIPRNWSAESVTVLGYTTVTFFGANDKLKGTVGFDGRFGGVDNICFTRGTLIETPGEPVPVEQLSEGDLVLTRDNGPQPIRWVGSSHLTSEMLRLFPERRPVRIEAGVLGATRDTLVSPAHRMLVGGQLADTLFGTTELLVPARDLVNDRTITVAYDVPEVDYFHVLLDRHELLCADGAWSESFHPQALMQGSVSDATRHDVLSILPQLERNADTNIAVVRPTVSAADVRMLGF